MGILGMDVQLTLCVEGVRFSIDIHNGFVCLGTIDLQVKDEGRILFLAIPAFNDYALPVLLVNWIYDLVGVELERRVSYALGGHCDLPKMQAELARRGESWEIKDGILMSPECSKFHHMALRRLIRGG